MKRILNLKLNKLPFKLKSEKEMSELLHRTKVLARKRQIEMYKLDNEIKIEPLSISQYMTPKRQIDIIKVVFYHLKSLLP